MASHHFQVQKTAHYYTIGEIGKHIRRVVFALHGYGQAGDRFSSKFDGMDDGETLIVCPEGLNRFYWKDFTGEVVASWMTRKNRDTDIADNMSYLNQLYDYIIPQLSDDVIVTVFGFSQGCPTASRWVSSQKKPFHHLVLWAGQLAHDEDYATSQSFFQNKRLLFVYGNEDEFLIYGYKEKLLEKAAESGLEFEVREFDGKHRIDRQVLADIFNDLKTVKKLF